jgi:hypothetical protein
MGVGQLADLRSPGKANTMTQQRVRRLSAFATAVVLVASLSYGCAPKPAATPVSLPVPQAGDVTFYLSLPAPSLSGLSRAASSAATPGSPDHRHFSGLGVPNWAALPAALPNAG